MRRTPEFLGRLICVAGAALVMNGCSTEKPLNSSHKISTPITEPVIKYPEIRAYYPSLEDYPLLSNGEFSTDRTHTKWFNFSRMNFDPALAQDTFKFFEDLAKSQKLISYPYRNQSVPFYLSPRPRTERVLFLIPQEALPPTWPDPAYTASTTGQFTNGPYVTFVRIPNTERDIPASKVFTTAEIAANKSFAVEACQSSLQVSSLDTEMANLGQEIVCNSLGAAFTLKQKGLAFASYNPWAKDVLIRKDPDSPSFPLYALNEADYADIPAVDFAIKNQK